MWDQLTTFWSLDRAEKHYSLKEQPLNMPLGSQNPYAKRAYFRTFLRGNNKGGVTRAWRVVVPMEGGVTRGGWCYPWRVVLPVDRR